MESKSLISPNIDILILLLAIIFFIVWIVLRRIKRKEEIKSNKLVKKPYTTYQILGILGILFILLPIFWIVGVMLQKGILLLIILLFGWIKLQILITSLKAIFLFSTSFLLFVCVYLVCALLWPNRYIAEADSVDSEEVHYN